MSSGLALRPVTIDVQIARLGAQHVQHLVERQVVVAQHDVELVEQHEAIGGIGDHRLRLLPRRAGGGDVAGAVLGLPGEAFAHGAACDEIGKARQHRALAGLPRAFDELHDADAHGVADAAHHHAEGGGRFALAGAGMDDEEAALLRLGGEDLGARRLALRHLLGVARVDLVLGFLGIGHGRSCSATLLLRGFHRLRSIASASRALISASAAGLCSAKNCRTSGASR